MPNSLIARLIFSYIIDHNDFPIDCTRLFPYLYYILDKCPVESET